MHDPLEGHRDVAEAPVPLARGVLLEGQWRHQFNLVTSPDAPLVDQVVAHGCRSSRVVTAVAHTTSFSGNAFSVKNARGRFRSPLGQLESVAERSHVADRQRDLVRRERIAERRHVAVEAAHRSTFMDDAEPVHVGFGCGKRAVGEIGQRRVESDDRFGRPGAVGTMAGDAGRPVEILRGALRSAGSLCAERRATAQDGERQNEQPW